MQLVWSLLGLILIAYVRIWIFTNYFSQNLSKEIVTKVLIFSALIAILLFVYHILPSFFGEKLSMQNVSYKSALIFGLYCISFILLFTLQMNNIKYKKIKQLSLIATFLFITITVGGISAGISSILMYYFISAYAEEILKFSIGSNIALDAEEVQEDQNKIQSKQDEKNISRQSSNLIFISILIGLGFSMIETVLYILNSYILGGGNVVALSISRGIFAGLLHLSATGLIAYFVAKNRGKIFSGIVAGIILGFALHVVYNLTLYYNITIATVVILIGCYFILTYLLFNSDIVYKKSN